MLKISIVGAPDVIRRLQERGPEILAALQSKMTELMFKLQSKIVGESIPTFFSPRGQNIARTVRAIPATLEGSTIVGEVAAGGPQTTKVTLKSGREVDYAAVQEKGISHSYEILPFNKKALAFLMDGKQFILKSVIHPPMKARPFMRAELENMESQIVAELQDTFSELSA